jgi:hypothetical protein
MWVRVCFIVAIVLAGIYIALSFGITNPFALITTTQVVSPVSGTTQSTASWLVDNLINTVQEVIDFAPEVASGDIMITRDQLEPIIASTLSMSDMHHQVRRLIIKQLLAQWYTGRNIHPRVGTTNNMITSIGTGDYMLPYPIEATDQLDMVLDDELDQYATIPLDPKRRSNLKIQDMIIRESDWRGWSDTYLFKQTADLKDLDYEIVSHRTRVNRDQWYRRFNIMTAFAKMGNVLVLNPWQSVEYMRDIEFDNWPRKNYKYGLSIIGDEEISDYGWGICGSSTALYQGILTNTALHITQRRGHTRWYSNLYPAMINGELIKTPGNDSALYSPSLDLHFTNIRSYPVIVVANYDGTVGGIEEIFSLAHSGDRGSMEFISSYKTSTVDTNGTTLRGGCYTWKINGEERKTCYKKVS